jgi:hypothetical protein
MRVILSEKAGFVPARDAAPATMTAKKENGAGRSRAVGIR